MLQNQPCNDEMDIFCTKFGIIFSRWKIKHTKKEIYTAESRKKYILIVRVVLDIAETRIARFIKSVLY